MTHPYDAGDVHPPPETERHVVITLTDAQIEVIAERVESRFYQRVGKKVVEKALWLLGIVLVGLVVFLAGKGALPK